MSRTLKWVLGILAVLVVVAIAAGAFWFWQNRGQMMMSFRPYATQPNQQAVPGGPNGQQFPNGPRGFNNGRNQPGFGMRGPMMGGRFSRFGPFGMGMFFLGGILRLIVPLGVLALVAFIFYQLGRRANVSHNTPPSSEPPRPTADTPNGD